MLNIGWIPKTVEEAAKGRTMAAVERFKGVSTRSRGASKTLRRRSNISTLLRVGARRHRDASRHLKYVRESSMPVPISITIPRLHPIQSQYQCRCQQQYNNIILNIINIKNIDIRADIDNIHSLSMSVSTSIINQYQSQRQHGGNAACGRDDRGGLAEFVQSSRNCIRTLPSKPNQRQSMIAPACP